MTDKEQAVLDAIRAEIAYRQTRGWPDYEIRRGVTANEIAHRMGIKGARRLGNGAVKGSWTGRMSPALRISPTLRSMASRGLLRSHHDDYWRHVYFEPRP